MSRSGHGSILSLVTAPAGAALGALFGGVGLVRRDRALHPRGVVLRGVLRRTGARARWGAPWLEQQGEDRGLVRLSRSVGLPDGLADILGLAFSFRSGEGTRHDLLLASTGLGDISRFVLLPARDPLNSTYSCLFPYMTPHGPVLLAAAPAEPRSAVRLDEAVAGNGVLPLSFRMLAAPLRGDWEQFGELTLVAVDRGDEPNSIRFDPVRYPLPGLSWPPWLARLREPAYAAARRAAPARRPSTVQDVGPTP